MGVQVQYNYNYKEGFQNKAQKRNKILKIETVLEGWRDGGRKKDKPPNWMTQARKLNESLKKQQGLYGC